MTPEAIVVLLVVLGAMVFFSLLIAILSRQWRDADAFSDRLKRIERALGRVEKSMSLPGTTPPSQPGKPPPLPAAVRAEKLAESIAMAELVPEPAGGSPTASPLERLWTPDDRPAASPVTQPSAAAPPRTPPEPPKRRRSLQKHRRCCPSG